MGGQTCVFYGAAEFSRDIDFAFHYNAGNLAKLRAALDELAAKVIDVPLFDPTFLERSLAVHFRCEHPDCNGLRVDLMSKMRGVDAFPLLWERRTVLELEAGVLCDVMGIADLVKAKKNSGRTLPK